MHTAVSTQKLNSSLLTKGSRMAKRNTVGLRKNKSNDQSE